MAIPCEVFVATGGQLVVDLTGWPSSEWAVTFKSSNPSVLELMPDKTESPATRPVATFRAVSAGFARVDAGSGDGHARILSCLICRLCTAFRYDSAVTV